jgi:dTDP-glucose pyrophosphorylase
MRDDLKAILVRPAVTVKEAMSRLDASAEQILLVTSADRVLLGTLTDGDIRRHILSDGSLSDPVSKICHTTPKTVPVNFAASEAKRLMVEKRIKQLPVLDAKRRVTGLLRWEDLLGRDTQRFRPPLGVPVVIMAGGQGVRLEPFTKILPKPLIPIEDRPLVQVIMDRFVLYGCDRFIMTVNYKAQMIKSYFSGEETRGKYKIRYIHEQEATGTAGSLALIRKRLRGDFFLSNCDVVIKADYADLLRFHRERAHVITIVASMQHFRVPYGVIQLEKNGSLRGIQEKPEFDMLANTGLYVLSEKISKYFPRRSAFDMTDLIAEAKKAGAPIGVFPVGPGAWTDVGQWAEYFRNMIAVKAGQVQ